MLGLYQEALGDAGALLGDDQCSHMLKALLQVRTAMLAVGNVGIDTDVDDANAADRSSPGDDATARTHLTRSSFSFGFGSASGTVHAGAANVHESIDGLSMASSRIRESIAVKCAVAALDAGTV